MPEGGDFAAIQAEAAENRAKKKKMEEEKEKEDASKRPREWKKLESKRQPGSFYYFDAVTGESSSEKPDDYRDPAAAWKKLESKTKKGSFYYFNETTGETSMEKPPMLVGHDDEQKDAQRIEPKSPVRAAKGDNGNNGRPHSGQLWVRKESASKPGTFYYFNHKTGANEMEPPLVDLPWKCMESSHKKGQYYYFNEFTNDTSVDPPNSARSGKGVKRAGDQIFTGASKRNRNDDKEKVPDGWIRKESDSHKNKFYYYHEKSGKTSWTRPDEWIRKESSSNPGKYYYQNASTGEVSWTIKT